MTASVLKVMPLFEAVSRFIRPGMALHLAYGGGRPNAAVSEIIRQYTGTSPEFIVSAHGFVNMQHALIESGLVARLVVAYAGENYPTPRPNPALQRAVRSGAVVIENWSLWTLTARLIAGALGLPFFPVKSLVGSGMADEHEGVGYQTVNAFGEPGVGVVSALRPDITLVQGLVADSDGNVILPPPYGESAWGALAAKGGVIACVEKLVSSDYIRAHNSLPMIPSHAVRAVCVVPFGSHPYGMQAGELHDVQSYREDDAFMAGLRSAAKEKSTFETWISAWITGPTDHDEFLARLGQDRLDTLAEPVVAPQPDPERGPANDDELMTLAAARILRERIQSAGHQVVLAGIGYAHLAAWTAVKRMREDGFAVELAAELGMSGFTPQPGDPYLFASQNFPTCLQLTDVQNVLARDVGGPSISSIGILGAGQIDELANINSTWSTDGDFIVGSGGANDVASAADEVIVVVKHSASRLAEKLDYVTAPGNRVSVIVTSKVIFERRDGRFVVTRWLGSAGESDIEWLRANTGWPVAIAEDAAREPIPSDDDLTLLRSFDPQALFLRA